MGLENLWWASYNVAGYPDILAESIAQFCGMLV